MSEEIATVDANLREIARLRAALEREKKLPNPARRLQPHTPKSVTAPSLSAIGWLRRCAKRMMTYAALLAELAAAHERERIAAEAYHGQQQSYRDLEALYQAMTERAQAAEAELARRRQAAHLNEGVEDE